MLFLPGFGYFPGRTKRSGKIDPEFGNSHGLRWPGDSQRESIRRKKLFSQRSSDSHESPQTCDSNSLLAPEARFAKKGFSLSGTGDSQRDSRESIRANHSQLTPLFS